MALFDSENIFVFMGPDCKNQKHAPIFPRSQENKIQPISSVYKGYGGHLM